MTKKTNDFLQPLVNYYNCLFIYLLFFTSKQLVIDMKQIRYHKKRKTIKKILRKFYFLILFQVLSRTLCCNKKKITYFCKARY